MFNAALSSVVKNEPILPYIFSDEYNPRLTWSIIDIVFQGEFVRSCFRKMTSDRLGRMQDSYEMFVLCANARKFETITDFRGLHYHFGNGCSGNAEETAEQFNAMQLSAKQLNDHVLRFADSTDSPVVKRCAQWLGEEYVRVIGNDWVIRLNEDSQRVSIANIVDTWGADVAYQILTDTLCARAEWFIAQGELPEQTDEFYRWFTILTSLEAEHTQNSGLVEKRGKVHEYERQFHTEKIQRERETKLRKEQEEFERRQRMELEKESRRRFKKGTLMRNLSDMILPENSLRRDLVSVITMHRKR